MATIERVVAHRVVAPLRRPFVTAVRTALAVDAVVVQISDSDGRSGWGEAATSWRVTGESAESVRAVLEGPVHEFLIGREVQDPATLSEELERVATRNHAARGAVDCALFDLHARTLGVPLWRLLDGESSRVRTDMTLSAALDPAGADDLITTALEHIAAGFATLKVKVAAGGDDVALLTRLREAVGPRVNVRVDANQGWSPDEAIAVIHSLERAGIGLTLVEQPVARDDVAGLARVTREVDTPVMADESVGTLRELREIIRLGAADLVNIKLAKTGGLRVAREMVATAHDAGLSVIVGCMAETHVGITAAAALASSVDARLATPRDHDLDGGLWIRTSPVDGGARYLSCEIELGEGAGSAIRSLVLPDESA